MSRTQTGPAVDKMAVRAAASEPPVHLGTQLRRMIALARPYFAGIALCLLLILAAMGIQLSLPLGVKMIFDRVQAARNASEIHLIAGGLLLIFVLRSVFSFYGQFLLQRIGDTVVVGLRQKLFNHYHALSLGYHQRQQVGDLLSRLSNDVAALRNAISNLAVSFVTNTFQLIGATVVMMLMNWRLGLIVLTTGPLVSIVTRLFGPVFQRLSASVQDQLAHSTIIAQESLSGIEVAKAFARGPYETDRYGTASVRFLNAAIEVRRVDAFFNALVAFLASFSTIAIFWFGGLEVAGGSLSSGTLVAFLLYSQYVTQCIATIAQQYSSFCQAAGASRRVFDILDTEIEVRDRADAVPFCDTHASVVFEQVSFEYRPGAPVLVDVSFRARPGEIIALVGASGSGKSTVLKLVSRLFDASSGTVLINGHDVRGYTLHSLQEAVAIVSQEVFLFGTSIRENIRYGRLGASDAEVEAAARAANAHEFVEQLAGGYDTPVGERGVQLSGGQRQRIAIARALLKEAPVLILDEATSAVDALSEKLIQEAVERMKARCTIFIIAHRLGTVRNADQILVFAQGRIVARPSYQELVRDQRYAPVPHPPHLAVAAGMHRGA